MQTYKLSQVLKEETALIEKRREKRFGAEAKEKLETEKFGIALSGGGIRSATINLGFLKMLNKFHILEKADYLSTVSGGGYIGAYVQASVKHKGYDKLFHQDKIDRLKKYGDYLIPGQSKFDKLWNTALLTFGYLVSWVMSLFSPLVILLILYLVYKSAASLALLEIKQSVLDWNALVDDVMFRLPHALYTLGGIMLIHFIINLTMNFNLNVSKFFTKLESYIVLIILVSLAIAGIVRLDTTSEWTDQQIIWALLSAAGLILLGFILNPNALSFHRFYRKQLADAFLGGTGQFSDMKLKDVFEYTHDENHDENLKIRDYMPPYPLINTCLNLQDPGVEDKFKGSKAVDYFLLSPKFCGSKLSGYVETENFPGFKHMTLPAALTISAAAVNPGMGVYSNKLLSIIMTLLNARLGFWVNNPDFKTKKEKRNQANGQQGGSTGWLSAITKYIVWWPFYFLKELFSKIGTTNRKLNISDGGHIENLGVFELIRRKCRLILAFDAGADPDFTFADLDNLMSRTYNELGVEIAFRQGQNPVNSMNAKDSANSDNKRFAVADMMKVWEQCVLEDENGQPITFKIKYKEKGEVKEKVEKLEYVIYYHYSKKDKNLLKFNVVMKAEEVETDGEGGFTKKTLVELHEKAAQITKGKLNEMTDKTGSDKIKIGTLVYIKPFVRPRRKAYIPSYDLEGNTNPLYNALNYNIYHPDFPHESTADQFFDPVQWESYFQLGQFIGTEVLGVIKTPEQYERDMDDKHDINIDQLIRLFDSDHKEKLFTEDEALPHLVDVSDKKAVAADAAIAKAAAVSPVADTAAAPMPEATKPVDKQPEPSYEHAHHDPELDGISEEQILEECRIKF